MVLSHTNVLSTVVGMQTYCRESNLDYSSSDNVLSYLTMAHILGRVVEEFALSCGASIGYWQVSLRTVDVNCICSLSYTPPFLLNSFVVVRYLVQGFI